MGKQRSASSVFSLRSIDFVQSIFLVHSTQVAVGLLTLPRDVVEEAKHDGWMCIIFAGVAIQLTLICVVVLGRRFGNLDLYGIFRTVFGKWVGIALGFLFAMYCMLVVTISVKTYMDVLLTWLFPTTSNSIFFLLLSLPILYCATGGARVIGRFALFSWMATVWLIFLNVIPATQGHWDYFRPFFDAQRLGYLTGTWRAGLSFLGFELILVFYPFFQKKEKLLFAASLGNLLTIIVYLFITLVSIAFMGEEFLVKILQPTLYLPKIVILPMLERVEQLVVAAYSFVIVATACPYLWSAGRFLASFGKWKEQSCVFIMFLGAIALGLFPITPDLFTKFVELFGKISSIAIFLMAPSVLLGAVILRKKGSQEPPSQQEEQQSTA